jgi:predicted nucleic acid-binding protein
VPGPLAVLDANVLFPFQLRNFLLHLSACGIFEPLWSQEILDEVARHLPTKAGLTALQVAHLLQQMHRVFPDALGSGYDHLVDRLLLPDPDDRHVLALAVHYEAEFLVTHNLGDFPGGVLHPLGVEALGPDAFVRRLMITSADLHAAAELHRLSLKRDPYSPQRYLESLTVGGLPRTAARLAEEGFLVQRPAVPDTSGR